MTLPADSSVAEDSDGRK